MGSICWLLVSMVDSINYMLAGVTICTISVARFLKVELLI